MSFDEIYCKASTVVSDISTNHGLSPAPTTPIVQTTPRPVNTEQASGALIKTLVQLMFKRISRLDAALNMWIATATKHTDPRSLLSWFLKQIMCGPIKIEIHNDCIQIFGNEQFAIHYRQLDKDETTVLLLIIEKWNMYFRRIDIRQDGSARPDFSECIFDHAAAEWIPRATICARMMSNALQQQRGAQHSLVVGPFFYDMYIQFRVAVEVFFMQNPNVQTSDATIIRDVVRASPRCPARPHHRVLPAA